jgi:hypothetical protein
MFHELSGFEFDWFAVDNDGNVALFAAAGEGFFPDCVAEHHKDHSFLSNSFPCPRAGTPEVWNDYAALGLFVFDWALPGGPYEKRVSPTRNASGELRKEVLAMPELPRFDGSFSAVSKVEHWQ